MRLLLSVAVLFNLTITSFSIITVNYTISPQVEQQAISPYIYGTNSELIGGENFTFYRLGGNRMTGYNWVNNASNAGSDYLNQSDDYMTFIYGINGAAANAPASVLTTFYELSTTKNAKCIITLPVAGYVAKDKSGVVSSGETAPSSRWCQVIPFKGSSLSVAPSLSSNSVFIDEEVNFLKVKYGLATSGGVLAYDLDNEPSLWSATHSRIHPNDVQCVELVQKSISCSSAIKSIDSTAVVFGPVDYGFNGFYNLQNASDWSSVSTGYKWYLEYFLDKLHNASPSGTRLLDVLDIHNYSEATGIHRINSTDTTNDTALDKSVRLQATRELWDKAYSQPSWIGVYFGSYLPYIPSLQTSINKFYLGTKISFTEYNYGAAWDITGGIAQADTLGIYGKYGIYAACYWPLNGPETYTSLAYKLFRNYDGNKSTFGETHVQAFMTDTVNSAIYASIKQGNAGELHIIVLNKSTTQTIQGNFTINSSTTFSNGTTYTMSSTSANLSGPTGFIVSGNTFTLNLPPLTASHLIITPTPLVNVSKWELYY